MYYLSFNNSFLALCQMNENPCSNQEIHVLFGHGFKLENTYKDALRYLHDVIQKALQIGLFMSIDLS